MRKPVMAAAAALAMLMSARSAPAQLFDPYKDEMSELLVSPPDAIEYYNTKEQIAAMLSRREWSQAEPLAERIVRDYPRDGENWTMLARAKRGLNKHAEAGTAFLRAGELSGWLSDVSRNWDAGINAAVEFAAAGNRSAALDVLRAEVYERRSNRRDRFYDWTGLESLRNDPEFKEILKHIDAKALPRVDGWRGDVEYLYSELQRTNPDYRNQPLPAEVTRRYEQLKRDIPKLSDEEVFIGLQRMVAPLRQGHVAIFNFTQNRFGVRRLPVLLYAFPEGIHIIDALPSHADLIGSKVTMIGTTPIAEAFRRAAQLNSVDGDLEFLGSAGDLVWAHVLKGTGITRSIDSATLTLKTPSGASRTVTLATVPLNAFGESTTSFPALPAPRGVSAPLFLTNPQQDHWEKALPEYNALYVHVRSISDDTDETLWDFGKRLRNVIAEQKPRNLIIDLRHNNGGSTNIYTQLLRTVIGFSQQSGNTVYALIGRRTYSATANFITELDRLAFATFAGEASSECCNFHGDPQHLTLPWSGIEGELTTYRWGLTSPWDGRLEMSPDIPVQLTAKDYFAGRDPVLDTVLRMIKP